LLSAFWSFVVINMQCMPRPSTSEIRIRHCQRKIAPDILPIATPRRCSRWRLPLDSSLDLASASVMTKFKDWSTAWSILAPDNFLPCLCLNFYPPFETLLCIEDISGSDVWSTRGWRKRQTRTAVEVDSSVFHC
jgi:hypothetical protein